VFKLGRLQLVNLGRKSSNLFWQPAARFLGNLGLCRSTPLNAQPISHEQLGVDSRLGVIRGKLPWRDFQSAALPTELLSLKAFPRRAEGAPGKLRRVILRVSPPMASRFAGRNGCSAWRARCECRREAKGDLHGQDKTRGVQPIGRACSSASAAMACAMQTRVEVERSVK
jgi:hypothetical protein